MENWNGLQRRSTDSTLLSDIAAGTVSSPGVGGGRAGTDLSTGEHSFVISVAFIGAIVTLCFGGMSKAVDK
jgi:hypothetical protein